MLVNTNYIWQIPRFENHINNTMPYFTSFLYKNKLFCAVKKALHDKILAANFQHLIYFTVTHFIIRLL